MDINELLKGRECSCGKRHECDIKQVIIKEDAILDMADILGEYHNILLVADKNTYRVCGEKTEKVCGDRIETTYVYSDDGILVPNESAIERLEEQVTDNTELIIGIGSGVIQDLCKYVSFKKNLPYYIVATAPSMDGYASKGAAMIIGNMKITYNAHTPEAIIGDVNILKDAPIDMIKSGYGDILGKFSCLNDWKLATLINDEYFCDFVYDLTYDMVEKVKDIGKDLMLRKSDAVKTLFEALVGVGVAMAYVGNSRPASGSEHHLSHFFEVIGIMNNEPYFLHGIDVAYSAVITQKLREELMDMGMPKCEKKFDKSAWEAEIKEVYSAASDGVIVLQNKLGWHSDSKFDIYKDKWNEILNVLGEAPSSDEMQDYLVSVELYMADFYEMYGEKKINNAIKYAMDLKDRYSVLWLYNSIEGDF